MKGSGSWSQELRFSHRQLTDPSLWACESISISPTASSLSGGSSESPVISSSAAWSSWSSRLSAKRVLLLRSVIDLCSSSQVLTLRVSFANIRPFCVETDHQTLRSRVLLPLPLRDRSPLGWRPSRSRPLYQSERSCPCLG